MSHAILITEENMPLILEKLSAGEREKLNFSSFIKSLNDYYFAIYYVTDSGKMLDSTIQSAYLFNKNCEFDTEQIKTEFTLFVKK